MEILDHIKEEEIIKEIQNGERSLYKLYYIKEKDKFIDWSTHRFGISEKKALRLYHKSILKLYETIVCRKIENSLISLNQTLYSITKVLMHEDPELKTDLTQDLTEEDNLPQKIREIIFKQNGSNEQPEVEIKSIWDSLDEKSRIVIRMLYFDNLGPEKIAEILGLENEEEVMKLKERIFTKFFKIL